MQKEIIIKNISAIFFKNLAVVGNMDPFLVFKLASSQGQTQVAKRADHQYRWSKEIKLTTFYQSDVQVVAYHQALTENKYIETATFNINELQNQGSYEKEFKDKQQKSIGYVYFTCVITQKPKYDYTILVQKIIANLDDNYDTFSSMEPFLRISHEQQNDYTQIIEGQYAGQDIKFEKIICFGFNDQSQKQKIQNRQKQLKIVAYEDDLTEHQYIGKVYIALHSLEKGIKKERQTVQLNGENGKKVGSVTFDYFITDFRKPSAKPLSPQKQCNPSIQVNISKSDRFKQDNSQKQINISKKYEKQPLNDQPQAAPQRTILKPIPEPILKPIPEPILDPIPETIKPKPKKKPEPIIPEPIIPEPIIPKSIILEPIPRAKNPGFLSQKKTFINSIYLKDSVFTLQRTIKQISIPKDKRFKTTYKIKTSETYRNDSDFSPSKAKAISFGPRFQNQMVMSAFSSRKIDYQPGPSSYNISQPMSKGLIFGKQQRFIPSTSVVLKSLYPSKLQNNRIEQKRKNINF